MRTVMAEWQILLAMLAFGARRAYDEFKSNTAKPLV